jgi:ubiquinone/menaquinone biosynthesis C-methylase UbiE
MDRRQERRDTRSMGFYGERIFPRIVNLACNTAETRRVRELVCAPLRGEVLEIGFGTGLNVPHLPSGVTKLLAVDPMERGRELAAERIAESDVPVEFIGLDGQTLALDDASVDAALSTWSLCTIPDAVAAVREVARVLRPGGRFHFAEHGASPDEKVRTWQDRLNGVQNRIACGCNMNREIPDLVRAGGMEIEELETFYAKGDPKILGWTFRGVAAPIAVS